MVWFKKNCQRCNVFSGKNGNKFREIFAEVSGSKIKSHCDSGKPTSSLHSPF